MIRLNMFSIKNSSSLKTFPKKLRVLINFVYRLLLQPRFIEITTIIGCKNCCSYCPQSISVKNYAKISDERVMSFDTFKKCVDKIPKRVSIYFRGFSEPYQNKDTSKMIRYAYDTGHGVAIFSTLVGMTMDDINVLKEICINFFTIHVQNIEENFLDYDDFLHMLNELTFINLREDLYFVYHGELDDRVKEWFRNNKYEPKRITLKSRASNLWSIDHRNGTLFCERMKNGILLPNGDMVLCDQDMGMKAILGNLLKDNYKDLYNNEQWKNIKKGMKNNDSDIVCRQCENALPFVSNKFFQQITFSVIREIKEFFDNLKTRK